MQPHTQGRTGASRAPVRLGFSGPTNLHVLEEDRQPSVVQDIPVLLASAGV